jgi:hypothetical protein
MRGLVLVALAVTALVGCNVRVSGGTTPGTTSGRGASGTTSGATTSSGGGAPTTQGKSYPGHGFVVHEWGTDTVVVGSDGSLQRGLHHEEEDLPSFVYDRISAGGLPGSTSVEVKMETPVTYFYSDTPRSVNVAVDFPQGVFTQWYPASMNFLPHVAGPGASPLLQGGGDPVLDPHFPFGSQTCKDQYTPIANGLLDWGAIDVLPRDQAPTPPDAPLAQYTWSYARNVGSNTVRVANAPGASPPQHEKFLFYRGLGQFDLPAVVKAQPGGVLSLENGYDAGLANVVVINIDAATHTGSFAVIGGGVAPGAMVSFPVPGAGPEDVDALSTGLAQELTQALDATGLYHDEAVAMVSTWQRQWFKTPGLRVLYLMPQPWTEASIPLTVAPPPDETVRVMMIRVEVLTPEIEQADTAAAQELASAATQASAVAYFTALGRFAEPRLRRALQILGNPPYAASYLATIATVDTRQAAGE